MRYVGCVCLTHSELCNSVAYSEHECECECDCVVTHEMVPLVLSKRWWGSIGIE